MKIYHQTPPQDRNARHWDPMFDGPEAMPWPHGYHLVAHVETTDLDRAWEATNHIDASWTRNRDVKPEPGMHRSSTVGDVFVLDSGEHWMVASCGFTRIDPENGLPLNE